LRDANRMKEGLAVTTLKVIEVLSQSDKSWEDAAQTAVNDAAKSVRGIKSIYIKELEGVVENNKVTQFRINAKVSFMVEGTQ
jgi:flavin-binding protein dodecin